MGDIRRSSVGDADRRKKAALDDLELRLRADGYAVVRKQIGESLPAFALETDLRPDAIAIGAKPHHWIEVIGTGRKRSRNRLNQLSERITADPDWTLTVVYAPTSSDDLAEGVNVDVSAIAKQLRDLERVSGTHPGPAFLYYWACLEGLTRARFPSHADQSLLLSSIGPLLVEGGYAAQDEGKRLRQLLRERNRIAHGQIEPSPSSGDVAFLSQLATRLLHEPVAA